MYILLYKLYRSPLTPFKKKKLRNSLKKFNYFFLFSMVPHRNTRILGLSIYQFKAHIELYQIQVKLILF